MPKVRIYRLEDSNGGGIYRTNAPNTNKRYVTHLDPELGYYTGPYSDRHAAPHIDSQLVREVCMKFNTHISSMDSSSTPHLLFGFKTLSQFRFWFPKKEWRLKLTALGIKLNMYEVDEGDVAIGVTQVIFDRAAAKLVESKAPMYRDC